MNHRKNLPTPDIFDQMFAEGEVAFNDTKQIMEKARVQFAAINAQSAAFHKAHPELKKSDAPETQTTSTKRPK